MLICDFIELPSSAQFTDEGYLKMTANIARVGTQDYDGVSVLRPSESVKDSVSSFVGKAITVGHPNDGKVTVRNTKDLLKGFSQNAWFDEASGWVKAEVVLTHSEAIAKFQDGWRYLSCGYSADLVDEDGIWKDELGTVGDANAEYPYQRKMTNIKGNHVSLVQNPRAGSKATFDGENDNVTISIESKPVQEKEPMKTYKIELLDGAELQLPEDTGADIYSVYKHLKDNQEQSEIEKTELKARIDELQGKVDALSVVKDEAPKVINEAADKRAEWCQVYSQVSSLIKDENPWALSTTDLKIAAVKASLDVDLTGKPDTYVDAYFDASKLTVKDSKPSPSQVLGQSQAVDSNSLYEKAWTEYRQSIESASEVK